MVISAMDMHDARQGLGVSGVVQTIKWGHRESGRRGHLKKAG